MKYIKVVDNAEIFPVNEEDIDIPGFVKDDFPVMNSNIYAEEDDDNDLKFQEGLERRYQDFAKSYLKDYEETQRMKQQDYQDYLDDLYDTDRPPVLGGSFLENW